MSVLTKEEIESLLVKAMQENEELREDNQKLLLIVADATEQIKSANNMAENYQQMFEKLYEIIKIKYDAEFKVEDIPKHLI